MAVHHALPQLMRKSVISVFMNYNSIFYRNTIEKTKTLKLPSGKNQLQKSVISLYIHSRPF